MELVDTHTHLYLKEFASDHDLLIKEANENGVARFLLPNIDSSSVDDLLKLVATYPDNCFPMMGVHPTSVKENYKDELKKVDELLSKHAFIAVGEVVMDF